MCVLTYVRPDGGRLPAGTHQATASGSSTISQCRSDTPKFTGTAHGSRAFPDSESKASYLSITVESLHSSGKISRFDR